MVGRYTVQVIPFLDFQHKSSKTLCDFLNTLYAKTMTVKRVGKTEEAHLEHVNQKLDVSEKRLENGKTK